MAIFPRRFFAASSVALLVAVLQVAAGAQRRQAVLYSAGASSAPGQAFEQLFADGLRASYDLLIPPQAGGDAVHAALQTRKKGELIFVVADRRAVTDMVRADQARRVLPELGLELLNPRLSASPLYLFARRGTLERLRQQPNPPIRVVFADGVDGLRPADVAGVLDPILRGRTAVTGPIASPRDLAGRLADDTVDVVAIFDTDPSPLRTDFVLEYEQVSSLGTMQLVTFPTTEPDYGPGRLRAGQGDLVFGVASYAEIAFNDVKELVPANATAGLLTVSGSALAGAPPDPGPLVLSNVRTLAGAQEHQRVWRLVGVAHLAALARTEAESSRCGQAPRPQYSPYLLNAHLSDREDVVRGLALWSDLTLSAGLPGRNAAEVRAQLEVVETMLSQRYQFVVRAPDWEELATRLGAGTSMRDQFSGQEATLFRQAVESIRSALLQSGTDRRQRLTAARGKLVELIRRGLRPSCLKGSSEGLFNAIEFDPFFYLGLVDAQLALETRPR